jgi:hypothetical protein
MTHSPCRGPRRAPSASHDRTAPGRGIGVLVKVLIICSMIAGCQPDMAGNGGSTGMFGFFKGKAESLPSTVSPALHATLKRETTFAGSHAPTNSTECVEARVDGLPPAARFVSSDFTGSTHSAFRIAGRTGLAPLGIVNIGGEVRRPQFWELAADADPTFAREIPVRLDPAENSWITASAVDAGCLPGPLLVLGLAYSTARPFQYVAVYNRETRQVRKIADAVYEGYSVYDGPSDRSDSLLETRNAGPDRVLLLYHTDQLRLRAEVYVRKYDHIMVFSPRHPQGIEVLKLGLDDGNVTDWAVVGKTLWLHTYDRRNDKQPDGMFWSLDLSSVL